MKHPLNLLTATAILVITPSLSCQRKTGNDSVPARADPTPQPPASLPPEEISRLQNEIDRREQNIQDLEAAVAMERAKLEENPDYDPSFLHEVLQEQERDRQEIEAARRQLPAADDTSP